MPKAAVNGHNLKHSLAIMEKKSGRFLPLFFLFAVFSFPLSTASAMQSEEEAASEVRLGSRIPRPVPRLTLNEREAVQVMHAFAECVSGRQTDNAVALLATRLGSNEGLQAGSRVVERGGSCLNAAEMRYPITILRGTLGEALYKRGDRPDPQQPIPLPLPKVPAKIRALVSFSACVAETDAGILDRLVHLRPGSKEEHELLNHLVQSYPACLPEGNFEVHAIELRAYLGEALYHHSGRPSAPPSAEQGS